MARVFVVRKNAALKKKGAKSHGSQRAASTVDPEQPAPRTQGRSFLLEPGGRRLVPRRAGRRAQAPGLPGAAQGPGRRSLCVPPARDGGADRLRHLGRRGRPGHGPPLYGRRGQLPRGGAGKRRPARAAQRGQGHARAHHPLPQLPQELRREPDDRGVHRAARPPHRAGGPGRRPPRGQPHGDRGRRLHHRRHPAPDRHAAALRPHPRAGGAGPARHQARPARRGQDP